MGSTSRVIGTSWDVSPWSSPFEQCCATWWGCISRCDSSDLGCSFHKSIGSCSHASAAKQLFRNCPKIESSEMFDPVRCLLCLLVPFLDHIVASEFNCFSLWERKYVVLWWHFIQRFVLTWWLNDMWMGLWTWCLNYVFYWGGSSPL